MQAPGLPRAGRDEVETMSELRVPVEEVVVQLVTADGVQRRGCGFLPLTGDDPPIPIPPSDWLARVGRFFPFLATGDLVPSLLNGEHVVALSVDARLEAPPGEGLEIRQVAVDCAGATFTGDVVLDVVAGRG